MGVLNFFLALVNLFKSGFDFFCSVFNHGVKPQPRGPDSSCIFLTCSEVPSLPCIMDMPSRLENVHAMRGGKSVISSLSRETGASIRISRSSVKDECLQAVAKYEGTTGIASVLFW